MPDMSAGLSDHRPVLCDAVLEAAEPALNSRPDPIIVDATVGFAGHASALASVAPPGASIVGLDRDGETVAVARERLAALGSRARVVQGCYSELEALVPEGAAGEIDLLLLDLGVNSYQLDSPERGFGIRGDGPIDMRFDRSTGPTALECLAAMDEKTLAGALRRYGDVAHARRVARGILAALDAGELTSTGALARAVERLIRSPRRGGIHSATTVFQALRIVTNDELGHLERFLARAPRFLRAGGRLLIISFHSGEDRLVKHALRYWEHGPPTPRGLPATQWQAVLRAVKRRSIPASREESEINPRARSARLRAAERTAIPAPATMTRLVGG